MIERRAEVGFTRAAVEYERARPGYPPAAVELVVERLGIGPGCRVLDLAAGTGKLTRQLVPFGAEVVAVEPLAAMREQFEAVLPDVDLLDGTAEAIPRDDGWADAVVVAQAFHWFDAPRALDEIHRVLRSGGGLALLWNRRPTDGWAQELDTLADLARGSYRGDKWRAVLDADPRFGERESAVFAGEHELTPDDLVAQYSSHSHVASLDDGPRAELLEAIATFLREHPETRGQRTVRVVRPCEVHWCRRH